jgi:6-pyruvoyltetrahydropterin/6-carboxytetrahydropterin synthase
MRRWKSTIGPHQMPFEISTTREFAAAHALRLYDRSFEPLHGHNWRIRITISAVSLDSIGVVMDFHALERIVDAIITPFQNANLNNLAPFAQELNPSAENVAFHVGRSLPSGLPPNVRLVRVEVWETSANQATYIP